MSNIRDASATSHLQTSLWTLDLVFNDLLFSHSTLHPHDLRWSQGCKAYQTGAHGTPASPVEGVREGLMDKEGASEREHKERLGLPWRNKLSKHVPDFLHDASTKHACLIFSVPLSEARRYWTKERCKESMQE